MHNKHGGIIVISIRCTAGQQERVSLQHGAAIVLPDHSLDGLRLVLVLWERTHYLALLHLLEELLLNTHPDLRSHLTQRNPLYHCMWLCRIKNAAQLGFKMASAAATPSVSHTAQMGLEGGRRLTANTGYRDDVGSLDTAMATSAAIAKAVNTPTKGAATYATDAGHAAAHVGTGAHPHTA